jgi:hypothetical protein
VRKVLIIALLLQVPLLSHSSDDLYVKGYLENLKASRTPVFYSECRLQAGKVGLVFPVGQTQGLFIERVDQSVVNSADAVFNNGKWNVDEALGGVTTITRVTHLIQELLGYSFQLVMPQDIERIATSKPNRRCLEKS